MNRYCIALLLAFSCSSLGAQTNSATLGLDLVQIKTIPFRYLFPGKSRVKVGTKTNGYLVTSVSSNEMSLLCGDKTIVLQKGRTVSRDDYEVTLADATNGVRIVRLDVEFVFEQRTLKLIKVDCIGKKCLLKDVESGMIFEIKMKAQPTGPRDGLPAAHDP